MLYNNIKLPLIFFILGTSLQSGFTTVILKVVDIFVQTGLYREHLYFTLGLVVTIPPSAVIQLHLLNIAMKYYDQMEVIPFYQTTVMIVWISTGLLIMDEAQFYDTKRLWGIFIGIMVSAIGIRVLMLKNDSLKQ